MTKIKHKKVGKPLELGLPPEDKPPKSPNGDDINLDLKREHVPSQKWAKVSADDIGEGFVPLDDAELEAELGIKPRYTFKTRKFKNRFVLGRSRFISYQWKTELVTKKGPEKKRPINEGYKVTKPQRRAFAKELETNISKVVSTFMDEILPVTLSVQTAADEVKDRMSQLIDDPVLIPSDYIRAKLLQAVQLRVTRMVCEQTNLNEHERSMMFNEFLPKVQPK